MDAKQLPASPSLEQYRKQAKELLKAGNSAQPEALRRFSRPHPRFRKVRESEVPKAFALADAQFVIAHEYGFESWPKFAKHIEALTRGSSPVSRFEVAVDAVVSGDIATLERLLRDDPELIRARSTREHRATLLHYVAANGVEDYRQKSPKNAVLVAETLLKAGAEVDAVAETYGGGAAQTTLTLLVSSVHPAKAAVQAALVEILLDFGAAINGLEDNGSPLLTALAFHYPEAAETLAVRGAKVDTVVAAAGMGRADLVKRFVDDEGNLNPDVPLVAAPWLGVTKDPRANVELALVWAAMHGRTAVVELLLRKGVDPGARDRRKWTALHWAAFYGYLETVQLLLEWNAPLEARNEFDGTVLDQTIWTTVHERFLPDHVAVIQKLIDAGAKVDPGWLEPDLHPPLDARLADLLRRVIARKPE